MKSPSSLQPPFVPEDWELISKFEAHVEAYFTERPDTETVTMAPPEGQGYGRRHLDEIVKRMRDVGWRVKPGPAGLAIEPPPLGESTPLARLRLGTAASNLVSLVQLVGATPVEALLDIYLDDLGIERLLTMRRLGTVFAPGLRVLTSPKGAKNLSPKFAHDVLIEIGATKGEVRVTQAKGHEGRFFGLAGSGILSIGCSLNSIDVNERAHRAEDAGEVADFEQRWATATVHNAETAGLSVRPPRENPKVEQPRLEILLGDAPLGNFQVKKPIYDLSEEVVGRFNGGRVADADTFFEELYRTICVRLILRNTGAVVARKVTVEMKFGPVERLLIPGPTFPPLYRNDDSVFDHTRPVHANQADQRARTVMQHVEQIAPHGGKEKLVVVGARVAKEDAKEWAYAISFRCDARDETGSVASGEATIRVSRGDKRIVAHDFVAVEDLEKNLVFDLAGV